MARYLILGSGYTGPHLKSYILENESSPEIVESSRTLKKDIQFEMEIKSTWQNLPEAEICFCLFPISNKELGQEFQKKTESRFGRLVICSSTGFFKTEFPDQRINEESPLDLGLPRAEAEEYLRENSAVVVHSAGIYGLKRNPLDWLKNGKVQPSMKFVNLIHVDDLAQFLWKAGKTGKESSRWIAADNHPMRWKDLAEAWEYEFHLELDTVVTGQDLVEGSKQIRNDKSIRDLDIKLKYPNVRDGVRSLISF